MTSESKVMIGIVVAVVVLLGAFALASKTPPAGTSNAVQSIDNSGAVATGPDNAPVTVVEFGDFQCPACGLAYPVVKQMLNDYNGKVHFVFRHFPLTNLHKNAYAGAMAAEAAKDQGKFWPMYDELYTNQNDWGDSNNPQPFFDDYAKAIGLDVGKFDAFIKAGSGKQRIDTDIAEGNKLNINATPTFYINGVAMSGAPSYDQLKAAIDTALATAAQSATPSPAATQ